ncbi:MAG: sugar phosphate isomerase/epimerase family protein [Candidatus Methanospirareceae archaeon]
MALKISFSSIDGVSDPREWMYKIEEVGFQGWEIIDEGSQRLKGDFKEEVREIYETTKLTLSLHAPFSDLNIASMNEGIWRESVRQIKESIRNVHEWIEVCVVHPGNYSPLSIQMPRKAKERGVEALKEICKYAAEYGIRVAVENMTDVDILLGRKPEDMEWMMKEVDMDNIGVCLDTGHANTTKTLKEWIERNVKIIHIHANDNFGERDDHLPIGEGNIDWRGFIEGLKRNNYKGLMVIEVRDIEAGERSLEWLRKNVL